MRFLLFLGVLWAAAPAPAAPDEVSFLAAWEAGQRADPKTVVFEKKAEGRYRFKTSRFPYDGELRVLNVTVNDAAYAEDDEVAAGPVMGFAEVELTGWSKDDQAKYAQSHGLWVYSANTLYFDAKTGKWWSPTEYQKLVRERGPAGGPWWRWVLGYTGYVWLALALYLVGVVFLANRRARASMRRIDESLTLSRRANALMEEALPRQRALAEEMNQTLKEILAELKARPGGR